MNPYRVVESRPDEKRLALRSGSGRFHLIRALNALPAEGAILHGDRPHLGFGLLLCRRSGDVYRVIFESINNRELAFDFGWMQPAPRAPLQAAPHRLGDR